MNNTALNKLNIGQKALITKWLDKYNLPYINENIKRITDNKGNTKAFEVTLDNKEMLIEYENENLTPEFIKSGEVIITLRM